METSNTWIDFDITRGPIRGKERNKVGLIVRVRARRDVEEFMSGLANGRRMSVDALGDGWYNCNPDGGMLEFYDAETRTTEQRNYTLDNIGAPLLVNPNEGRRDRVPAVVAVQQEVVNLSFLKLAGISNESGVPVGLVGAYSWDYINKVRTMVPAAITQFLRDYLVPIHINLQIVSRS